MELGTWFGRPWTHVICARCFDRSRCQRTVYDMKTMCWVCPYHGAILTAEWMFDNYGGRR